MKRILLPALCCLLMAAIFAGCAEAIPQDTQAAVQPTVTPTTTLQPSAADPALTIDQLTAEKMEEIEAAWLASKGHRPGWYTEADSQPVDGLRYYGSYNGYDILFEGTELTCVTTKEIGGVSFTCAQSFVLYAYSDGVFYELEEAFAHGLISEENLQEAAKIHLSYQDRLFASDDVIEAMKAAFLSQYVTKGDWTTADLTVIYYGEYDGAHVGFINGIFGYTQALTSETVGKFTFRYNTGQKLQLYYDGQLMSLKDAYDKGILTDEAVARLYQAYAKAPAGDKE